MSWYSMPPARRFRRMKGGANDSVKRCPCGDAASKKACALAVAEDEDEDDDDDTEASEDEGIPAPTAARGLDALALKMASGSATTFKLQKHEEDAAAAGDEDDDDAKDGDIGDDAPCTPPRRWAWWNCTVRMTTLRHMTSTAPPCGSLPPTRAIRARRKRPPAAFFRRRGDEPATAAAEVEGGDE